MLSLFRRIVFWLVILILTSLVAAPALAQKTHTVARGENLFRIGLRYGCSISEMARANNISNPARIFVGQVLVVPACSGATVSIPTPANVNTPPNSAPAANPPATTTTNTSPSDNWCFPGGPWGDGRCDVGDEGQRNYMWRLGWLNAHIERGEIATTSVPANTGFFTNTTTNNNSGGTTNNSGGTTTTTTTTGGGSSSGGSGTPSCVNGTVIELVNCARGQNGLAPLFSNALLEVAAQAHAQDMVTNNYFSHTGLNGSTLGSRVTAVGYNWTAVGENIAQGQSTDYQVFNDWMNSPGHRANILSPSYTEIGVGRVGNTWVQVFGKQ